MQTYLVELNEYQKRLLARLLEAGADSMCGELQNEPSDPFIRLCERVDAHDEAKALVQQFAALKIGQLNSIA